MERVCCPSLQNYKMRECGARYSYKIYEQDKQLFFTAEL